MLFAEPKDTNKRKQFSLSSIKTVGIVVEDTKYIDKEDVYDCAYLSLKNNLRDIEVVGKDESEFFLYINITEVKSNLSIVYTLSIELYAYDYYENTYYNAENVFWRRWFVGIHPNNYEYKNAIKNSINELLCKLATLWYKDNDRRKNPFEGLKGTE